MKALKHILCARAARQSVACLLAFCIVNIPVLALEMGDTQIDLSAGSAGLSGAANTVSVDLITNQVVLDWSKMDIGTGKAIDTLSVGGGGLYLLNRVDSQAIFNGTLNALGKNIFIVSQYGVEVGLDASITASSFTAAGLNISNEDFMNAGGPLLNFVPFEGGVVGDVINQADIIYDSGTDEGVSEQVNLLGKMVRNEGIITLPEGGVVVMAAGENVYLGDPGGKVIVEMTGIEDGSVTNSGDIESPNGKIVMAAGDIYSIPLHPQLQVGEIDKSPMDYDYTDTDDKADIDLQPVRAETGMGSVTQAGDVNADGADGKVIMTAGDAVNLDGTTSAVGGSVCAYAYDFGDKEATTYFNDGAEIAIGDGFAGINGNHVLFDGTVDALPEATIQVDPVTLTIADDEPLDGPELDTLYEEMIENYSNAGYNLDLAADELITVEYMADSSISGGSGDISLRNVFDTGGILFEESDGVRTAIDTTATTGDGGNIYMTGGAGGIVAGDLYTTTPSNDKISNPGKIILLTTNGGDMEVGSMVTERGNISEISAISSGDLIVNGEVVSENATVSKDTKDIGFARICLAATEDIVVDAEGGGIAVNAHGKYEATADIIICAGEDIIITNLNGGIEAYAQTSENTEDIQLSNARVDISAGSQLQEPGDPDAVISINGVTFDAGGDNSGLPVAAETKVSGGGSPLRIDTGDTPAAGDPGELIWEETKTDPEPVDDYQMHVKIEINGDEATETPCSECPTPPGLPPVPHIFWIMDDEATMSWSAVDFLLDVLANDDNGSPLDGSVSFYTLSGGTLSPVYDNGDIVGFEYTPPSDAVFIVSNEDPTVAIYTDSFTYKAYDADGNESLNTATVSLKVTNYLPTLTGASDSIHMSTADNPTSSDFDLSTLITDPDGTPGTITYGIEEGLIPVSDGSIATDTNPGGLPDTLSITDDTITYSPYDGYVSPTDEPTTFDYSVTDSSIVDAQSDPVTQTEDLDVTVTNTLPSGAVVLDDAHMDADGQELSVDSGDFSDSDGDDFVIAGIDPATDDYNKTFGGTLDYNGDNDPYNDDVDGTYDYTADASLPGYTGEDDFDAQLWDGQQSYSTDGSSEAVYGSGTIDLEVTNEVPSGAVTLEDAPMNAVDEELPVDSGDFTDGDGDEFAIADITKATDDENLGFGGDLDYNGTKDPYASGDTYNYSSGPLLPGYTGEDDFDVQLWDGQIDYTFTQDGDVWVVDTATNVYGSGSIDLEVTNELPGGDAWFGQVHMDSQDVTQDLEADFGEGVVVNADTYTGSVIGSDNYGGTLVYDGENWTYSTDTDLPGYVGDENDQYGEPGYVADDLFAVNLSSELGQQYDYWFSEDPAPEGYEFYEPAEIYRKAVSAEGTVSVDITNELPTINTETTVEHMNEDITDKLFAQDNLDGNPINELDDLSVTSSTDPGFGSIVLTDNGDGTYSYTYAPADGFIGDDSFDVTVWDGQTNYTFVDGAIESSEPVTVSGTVSMQITNIIPNAEGDLGEVGPGDPPIAQDGVVSPVLVTDPEDVPYQNIDDVLSIVPGIYTLPNGSSLEFTGTEWIYTPAPGAPESETFTIQIWDGQYDYQAYYNGEEFERTPVYGEGSVTVSAAPEIIAVAPLQDLEIPELKGCPVVMDAAATELAINSDELQLRIQTAMATNPNLQPCNTCEQLLTAATILQDAGGERLAAMNEIFNQLAPADAPFTPEVQANIQTAFANLSDENPQYAMAGEYVEAFVEYVAAVNELQAPVGDPVEFALDKHDNIMTAVDNPNIAAYMAAQAPDAGI